jgi:hypothetical protein
MHDERIISFLFPFLPREAAPLFLIALFAVIAEIPVGASPFQSGLALRQKPGLLPKTLPIPANWSVRASWSA